MLIQTSLDYQQLKMIFDWLGYLWAAISTWYFKKCIFSGEEITSFFKNWDQKLNYYLVVITGAMMSGVFISTLDGSLIPGRMDQWLLVSKSIAGALFGGVIAAEIFKKIAGIRGSTGILFLPGILVGVFLGRFGAIATGVRDFTYGVPTNLPWWMDLGDGIVRHPTMIYEMIVLTLFAMFFVRGLYTKQRSFWITRGFYLFIGVYFTYRFGVGFIQPYSNWWGGLSTYQVIALPMVIYSGVQLISTSTNS
jgi:phosphatidylglycerol---prolipoprotein diacylglyceryl transferase